MKPLIEIIIDTLYTDCGDIHYIVKDANSGAAPNCTMGNGHYINESEMEFDMEDWKKDYTIEIVKDYR